MYYAGEELLGGGHLDPLGKTAKQEAAIYNAAYMVRHYGRGELTSIGREQRDRAILQMGAVVRDALSDVSEPQDVKRLLIAVVTALSKETPPPF